MAGFAVLLAGCSRGPSEAQLDVWLAEVNREEAASREQTNGTQSVSWTLAVRGNVRGGGVDFPWPRLAELAGTHLMTTLPTHTEDVSALLDFRGILFSDLMDEVSARETDGPGGHDMTLIASDGFLTTRPMLDTSRFPAMLAIEQNGEPLSRKQGGPLLEVLPHSTHPDSKKLHSEGGAFYVTTAIVGTEAVAIAVGGKTLKATELDALESVTLEGRPGFRFRWSSSSEKVHGPRLRDVIASAGIMLQPGERVLIHRKPRTETLEREVLTLAGEDVLGCDVILGLRYDDNHSLIPAGRGGPAVIAFPPAGPCATANRGQVWPMFVESIEVVRGDAGVH